MIWNTLIDELICYYFQFLPIAALCSILLLFYIIANWSLTLLFLISEWDNFWLPLIVFFLEDATRVWFHLWTLYSSIQTKKTEKKKNLVAREIATGKTMTLFGALIFKTVMESRCRSWFLTCIYDGPPYGSRHSYDLLSTVAKNSTLDVWKGPRSLWAIYDILIFYILKKQKIWFLLHIPLSIL